MFTKSFHWKALFPVAILALQGCSPNVDHTYLPPPGASPGESTIFSVRRLINLQGAPNSNQDVSLSLILRNLPDLELPGLGPSDRADFQYYDRTTNQFEGPTANPAARPSGLNYYTTEYSSEADGSFLASVAIGGGSFPIPTGFRVGDLRGAAGFTGLGGYPTGISPPAPIEKEANSLGIVYQATKVQLFSTNYNSDHTRAPTIEQGALLPTAKALADTWIINAWPSDSWKEQPLLSLQHANSNPPLGASKLKVIYFGTSLFPLEFVPGTFCVDNAGGDPGLLPCIQTAFGLTGQIQGNTPRYQAASETGSSSVAYSDSSLDSAIDWIKDTYDELIAVSGTSNSNPAIIVVPAGDHGGVIPPDTSDPEMLRDNKGNISNTIQIDNYFPSTGVIATGANSGEHDFGAKVEQLKQALNSAFFNPGVKAPTNIFAWAAAADNNILPVVAVGLSGELENSTACGEHLKDYCVAAPGSYFAPLASGDRASFLPATADGGTFESANPDQATTFPDTDKIDTVLSGPRITYVYKDAIFNRGAGASVITGYVGPADDRTQFFTLPPAVAATEVAASIVTGAVTLISQQFSGDAAMTSTQVLARLRQTAIKTGIYADSTLYGQGLVNVGAAVTAQGTTSVPLTGVANGASLPLVRTALTLQSTLFGDAVANSLKGRHFVTLDSLQSPFLYQLDGLLRQRTDGRQWLRGNSFARTSTARLADGSVLTSRFLNDGKGSLSVQFDQGSMSLNLAHAHPGLAHPSDLAGHALLQADSALAAPWAATDLNWQEAGAGWQVQDGQQFSVRYYRATEWSGEDTPVDVFQGREHNALAIGWQGDYDLHRFGLQHIRDDSAGDLLGLSASGGLGSILAGRTHAFNAWGNHQLTKNLELTWSLWEMRARSSEVAPGALSHIEDLTADSRTVALSMPGPANSQWRLRLEQPVRARSGTLNFSIPTAHTRTEQILFSPLNASVAPSGREIRLQTDFSLPLDNKGGYLHLSAGQAHQPGHIRSAANDYYALVGLELPL